ncbi:MAG: hypothetical protein HYW27_00800 [Candidatus Aenigmarchaeota archaeon]|nr:hypothetical protein [Candidatus Aenigmarchaeota archaeon]
MDKHLLAYETGIHLGDGNLYETPRMQRITYSGNLENEREFYKEILFKILEKLFEVTPLYYERKTDNSVLLVINSKKLTEFKRGIGLAAGNKTKIKIPEFIKKEDELLKKCLMGIGDTDFSLSFKKNRKGIYTEPRMELFCNSRNLALDISSSLKKFGFTFSFEETKRRNFDEFRIRMYGKKNLEKWINEIGFRNPYILSKIEFWKKFGYFIPKKNYSYYKSASASG